MSDSFRCSPRNRSDESNKVKPPIGKGPKGGDEDERHALEGKGGLARDVQGRVNAGKGGTSDVRYAKPRQM